MILMLYCFFMQNLQNPGIQDLHQLNTELDRLSSIKYGGTGESLSAGMKWQRSVIIFDQGFSYHSEIGARGLLNLEFWRKSIWTINIGKT